MSDTSPGPDQQSSPEHDQEQREWQAVLAKFRSQARYADVQFLYRSWSAWTVDSRTKAIRPVARVIIGDDNGDIIFDRLIVLSALAELTRYMARTLWRESARASEMSGFRLNLPGKDNVLMPEVLKETQDYIAETLETLEKYNFLLRESSQDSADQGTPDQASTP